ncbi:hypothetical protein HOY82DRAFT_555460 [Tuber indicum]|nr:hypothetical protein HOY82DRAFT_555460 [Tuber indicum]
MSIPVLYRQSCISPHSGGYNGRQGRPTSSPSIFLSLLSSTRTTRCTSTPALYTHGVDIVLIFLHVFSYSRPSYLAPVLAGSVSSPLIPLFPYIRLRLWLVQVGLYYSSVFLSALSCVSRIVMRWRISIGGMENCTGVSNTVAEWGRAVI